MKKTFTAFIKAFLPAVMLLILIMAIAGCSVQDKPVTTPGTTTEGLPSYGWPATGLASVLPQPESARGQILTDETNVFRLEIYEVTPLQYHTYVAQCKAAGFFEIVLKYDTTLILSNTAGNSVTLQYSEEAGTLRITLYAPGILSDLTYSNFVKPNAGAANITKDINLPADLKVETENGKETLALTWTSSNPEILSTDGVVTRPEDGDAEVILTATASNGMVKEYPVRVLGKTGPAAKGQKITFNTNHRSATADMGQKQRINYAVLTDTDNTAMLTSKVLTLWVSDDGENYTQIKNYKMLHIGPEWYLYGFDVEGRYIKAEYTMFDSYYGDFIGIQGKILVAGYEDVLGSNGAPYRESTYTLKNNTGKTQLDAAWTVSKADLGITGSDASIRILLDGAPLYHYVDGDNVIFRIDNFEKDASITLTVQQSDSIAPVDYSNKEGVYEVTYGTVSTTLNSNFGTSFIAWHIYLEKGTVFPDGSVQEYDAALGMSGSNIVESVDGGKTWTTVCNCRESTPEGGVPATKGSYGPFIYDEVTHRIVVAYSITLESVDLGGVEPLRRYSRLFMYSDDGGKTWSQAGELPSDPYESTWNIYNLSCSNGIMTDGYDGEDGDGVDYVIMFDNQTVNDMGEWDIFQAHIAYSRDAGLTWQWSETPVNYLIDGYDGALHETGMSESVLTKREDGMLVIVGRNQYPEVRNYAISYSIDNGVTWRTDAELSGVYATNAMPQMNQFEVAGQEDVIVLSWPGTNMIGSRSYFRTPLDIAVSTNGGETFRGTKDVFFGTALEDYEVYCRGWGPDDKRYNLIMNQVSNKSGENAYRARLDTNLGSGGLGTAHIDLVIDEFDDWFTRTKGVFDSFEGGTTYEEGWLRLSGSPEHTAEMATDGNYAIKLTRKPSMARSIPYLQDGTFSVDIYITKDTELSWEFQVALSNKADNDAATITMRIADMKVTFDGTKESVALAEGWNTFIVDLKLTECKASFHLEGGESIDVPVNEEIGNYVTYLTFFGTSEFYFDNLLVQYDQELALTAAEGDKEAAEAVIEKIKAIGEMDATKKSAVEAARSAYNKLNQVQKDFVDRKTVTDWNADVNAEGTLVNYYDVLKAAEAWLAENA